MELERCGKKLSCPNSIYYLDICMGGLRKISKISEKIDSFRFEVLNSYLTGNKHECKHLYNLLRLDIVLRITVLRDKLLRSEVQLLLRVK